MLIPRMRGWTTPCEITVLTGPLRNNLFDALVFLSLIPLAEVLEYVKGAALVPTLPVW